MASPLSFWDLSYRAGDHQEHWSPPRMPPELRAALDNGLVGPGETALDIGCGAGEEAIYLAAAGVRVIGVDSSPVALELARERAEREQVEVEWRLGAAEKLPVEDDRIDLALDRGCFHVIGRRRRNRYAREVARVLRPGGRLLLRGAREDDEEAGLVGFDRRELEARFGPHGFSCLSLEPVLLEARAGDLEGWNALLGLEG